MRLIELEAAYYQAELQIAAGIRRRKIRNYMLPTLQRISV